jgi:Na+-driven multidrug efflux pump
MSFLTVRISTLFALVIIWQVSSALIALNDCWYSALYLLLWMMCKSVGLTVLVHQSELHLLSSLGELHAFVDVLFAAIGLSLVFIRHKSSLFSSSKAVNGNLDTILIICQQLMPACSLALLTYIASQFDAAFIAVFALTFKIEALALLIPMVLTASLPAIVGVNYWSNNKKRAVSILKSAFYLIIAMQGVIAALLYLFQSQLFAGICPDCQQIALLKYFIQFLPISYVGLGMAMVYVSCLNAMGKSKQAMVFLAFHRLLLIPVLAVLGLNLLGNLGLFIGLAVSHLVMGCFVFYQITVVYSRSSDEQNNMAQLDLQTEEI